MKKVLLLLTIMFLFAGMAFAGQTVIINSNVNASVYGNGPASDGTLPGGSNLLNPNYNEITINSCTVSGAVFGAYTNHSGDVTGNRVTVNGGIVGADVLTGYVYGGWSNHSAIDNSVIINGGNVNLDVYGGYSSGGNAIGNSVTIDGGTLNWGTVYGGYIFDSINGGGIAANNSVIITSSTMGMVFGGYIVAGRYGKVAGNSVTITSNTMSRGPVYGGYISSGDVIDNSVIINNSAMTRNTYISSRKGLVYGGYSYGGNVTGSSVAINSSAVSDHIYGGFVEGGSGDAADNSVIITSVLVSSNIYGGYIENGRGNAKGNTIIINGDSFDNSAYGMYGGYVNSGSGNAIGNNVVINSGTINGKTYGGYIESGSGKIIGNNVVINGGTVNGFIHGGGINGNGNIAGNFVTVNGGTVNGNVYGGYVGYSGNVTGNTVTVNGGTVNSVVSGGNNTTGIVTGNRVVIASGTLSNVYGGRSNGNGDIIGNTVIINGGKISIFVYGGYSPFGTTAGNSVIITNGIVEGIVYGGYIESGSGNVDGNTVTVNGGNLNHDIYGGWSIAGNAAGNSVTVNGGTMKSIYGGYSVNGNVTDNSVTISGAPVFSGSNFYGGSSSGSGDVFTGNTLNVRDYSGSSIVSVQNFQYYNFVFPAAQSGSVLNVVGTAALCDGAGKSSIVTAGTLRGTKPLQPGASVTLIQAGILDVTDFTQTQAEGTHGSFLRYLWELDTAGNALTATLISVGADQQAKILSEGAAAGAILASQGAGLAAGDLLSNLQEGKVETIAAFFGGSLKYDTGSSVKMTAMGAAFGAAKKFNFLSAGIFVEYAGGGFDTEYGSLKGDGSASAIGAGFMVKKDIKENIYAEGLIRGGQLSNEYKTNVSGTAEDFDYSSTYFGFSLGGGYIFKVNEKINIDAFGRYALTSVSVSDTKLSAGEKYEIDSVLSNRIKAGAKGEYQISDTIKPYVTVSYDHELSGDINTKIEGYEVEAPTLNGGTLSAGIGASAKVMSNLTLDLSAQIYSGAREGVAGSLKAKYEF